MGHQQTCKTDTCTLTPCMKLSQISRRFEEFVSDVKVEWALQVQGGVFEAGKIYTRSRYVWNRRAKKGVKESGCACWY